MKLRIPLKFLFLLGFLAFFLPAQAAAKGLVLSGPTSVEIGPSKYLRLDVFLDTGGERVTSVDFGVSFNTELLTYADGSWLNTSGSVCSIPPFVNPSGKITCGFAGGWIGSGHVVTLVFQGRNPGTDSVSLSGIGAYFISTQLAGFVSNSMDVSVYGAGLKPTPTTKPLITPTPLPSYTPTAPISSGTTGGTSTQPGTTFGSGTKVPGTQGSTAEDPLQPAATPKPAEFTINTTDGQSGSSSQTLIKDLFSDNQKALMGFFPTIILLFLVIHLAIKLYFTEKRRRLELEKLFEDQLGSLSSLESKFDLLDQKGGKGREQFMQEFEETKKQILTDINPEFGHGGSV